MIRKFLNVVAKAFAIFLIVIFFIGFAKIVFELIVNPKQF